jgi:hypothetical protein
VDRGKTSAPQTFLLRKPNAISAVRVPTSPTCCSRAPGQKQDVLLPPPSALGIGANTAIFSADSEKQAVLLLPGVRE